MNSYDSQIAARVWQRVQAKQEPVDLLGEVLLLLAEEANDATLFYRLSKNSTKEKSVILENLLRSSRQSLSILRGIHFLLLDRNSEPAPTQTSLSSASLRRCYGDTLRRSLRYGQWCSHSEYTCAFTQLERLAQQRCVWLLQLIGTP